LGITGISENAARQLRDQAYRDREALIYAIAIWALSTFKETFDSDLVDRAIEEALKAKDCVDASAVAAAEKAGFNTTVPFNIAAAILACGVDVEDRYMSDTPEGFKWRLNTVQFLLDRLVVSTDLKSDKLRGALYDIAARYGKDY